MDKPEMETIDKLFNCMREFYKERWVSRTKPVDIHKTMWQSLYGCTYDQIRGALVLLKQSAKNPASVPPHHLEFHRYTKGARPPMATETISKRGDPEIARRALDEINAKLRYKDATR